MTVDYDSNVYYHPEKWDLMVVAELELTEPSYSFDTVVVWRHGINDKLYWAHDSGCSCPSPFEDFHDLSALTEVDYEELEEFVEGAYDQNAKADFLLRVRQELGYQPRVLQHRRLDGVWEECN